MTDYKLVPVEPTPEMVGAAEDAYMPFGDMELAVRMAVLAAPAVQWEPVGEVRLELGAQPYVFAELYSKSLSILAPGTKLYAAPQPAEQQPDDSAAARLDKQCREDVAAALGFIRGGNYAWSYLLQQIKDITSAEGKQPAPDVAALVDLLRDIGDACRQLEMPSEADITEWAERIDAALATHHKQGGEV